MTIVKAKFVEVEIQQQTDPDAAAPWMTITKYEPEAKEGVMPGCIEVGKIFLSEFDPVIRWTKDLGDKIIDLPMSENATTFNEIERRQKNQEAVFKNDAYAKKGI